MAATAVDASTSVQAASKVPSPTKLRFLAMDVKSSDRVAKVVPFMDKENAKKMIPIHIRASCGNPRAVLLAMEGYRRMTGKQQQKEHQTWRDMSRAEQRRFKAVLDNLDELKEKLIAGSVSWEEVAPSIETMLNNAPRMNRKRSSTASSTGKQKKKCKLDNAPQTDTTHYYVDEWTKQKVESRSNDRSQSTARSEPLQRTSLVVASKTTNTQAVSHQAPADCAAPRCSANGNTQAQVTVRPQRGNNDAR